MLLLLAIFTFVASDAKYLIAIRYDQIDTRVSLGKCIIEATKLYFNSDFETITFSLPIVEVQENVPSFVISHYVLGVLQGYNEWTFTIKNVNFPTNEFNRYPTKTISYIIQIRQRGEFAENLKKLKSSFSWNPHAKFLIVSPTLFSNPESVAIEITEVLWKQHVLDAAILLVDPKNTTTFFVYSWEPYSDKGCGGDFSNIFLIDKCSYGIAENTASWFDNKLTSTFNNCTLTASFIIWPPFVTTNNPSFQKSDLQATQGIEVSLLNMIAEYLNLYVEYLKSNETTWGLVLENSTVTGDLRLLANDEFDLVLGGYISTFGTSIYFDCSRSYLQESLVWCAPHEPILFGLEPMIKILSREIWIGLTLVYLIVTLVVWFLSKLSRKERLAYKQLPNVFLNTFLVLIGFAANVLPRSKGARFFIGIFILFSLHLNMLYTSYLTSTLSSQGFKEKYVKLEQIYNDKLNTYFIPDYKYFFKYSSTEDGSMQGVALNDILNNWKDCNNVTYCIEEIIDGKPNALCLSELYKEYVFTHIPSFFRKKYKLNCLNQRVATFPINLIMRKGFPLYEAFTKIIDRIRNAGFIAKWEKDLLSEKRENTQYAREMRQDYASIKFDNLKVIFDCLIFCLILCILVFIGELVTNKKKCKSKQ